MIKKEWPLTIVILVLFTLFLAACGTLEVGVEPGLTATSEETAGQVSPTPLVTPGPLVVTVSVPTPTLSPTTPTARSCLPG